MHGEEVLDRMRDGQALAREVFETAMRVAMGRDLSRRSILLGLWQTSVSTILAVADRDDAAAVLMDRASAIRGQGANADAPVVRPDPETARRRAEESSKASEVIAEHLDGMRVRLAAMGTEDDFPEIVLDTAIQYLVKAWGPAHTRRALAEQAEAILGGATSPIFPPEPSAWNGQGRPTPPGRPLPPGRRMVPSALVGDFSAPTAEAKAPSVANGSPTVVPPEPGDDLDRGEGAPPPPDDAEEAPPIESGDESFTMEDDGFDTFRASGVDEADGADETEVAEEPEGDPRPPASNSPGLDDTDFVGALEALGGEVPVPDLAELPSVFVAEETRAAEPVAPPLPPEASAETVEAAAGDSTFDDLMSILDVPPPEKEPEGISDFDDMPVPPSSTDHAVEATAWQRMAASQGDEDSSGGDTRWDMDDEPEEGNKSNDDAGGKGETVGEDGEESEAEAGAPPVVGTGIGRDESEPEREEVSDEPEAESAAVVTPEPDDRTASTAEAGAASEGAAAASPAHPHVRVPTGDGSRSTETSRIDIPRKPEPSSFASEEPAVRRDPFEGNGIPSIRRRHGPDRGRAVECLLMVEADDAGESSAYACVTVVSTPNDDHVERREMEGSLPLVGRRATLAAVVKALVSLGEPAEAERVRILVDSDAILAGVAPASHRPPRARPDTESEAWEAIDDLCASRSVQWIKRKPGIARPMSEACDKMIRRRLESRSKS